MWWWYLSSYYLIIVMGAQLCSMRRQPRCKEHVGRQEPDESSNVSHSSLAELLSSEYSSKERKNKRALSSTDSINQTMTKVRKLTLEEWLISSPTTPKSGNATVNHGELYVFRNFTTRVFPTSPMMHHTEATDLNSREVNESHSGISVYDNHNHVPAIGKAKKQVSFKLPEEADIIIFYSPTRELQAIQASTILMEH